ncbi:MAG: ribonuclease III [Alphaproteobacteria bacterium]|nr:MAG: ribonuclease III [Alphaproteobacteria bacterium]
MREALAELTGHRFRDLTLARTALTHPSLEGVEHYERLEFLGDRVLGLIIAHWLFDRFPSDSEGRLNRRLTALVRKETLAEIARAIGLDAFIAVADNARAAGVQQQANVLADVLEALVAALYLDGGLTVATDFVRRHWKDRIDQDIGLLRDPKSALQEWAHAHHVPPPVYELLAQSGPDHAPRFTVEARLAELDKTARGEAGSKRAAEQEAARRLLDMLTTGQPRHRSRPHRQRPSGER